MITLEGGQLPAVGVNRGDRFFAGAGQADADIRVTAFTGTVDHTAHDRDLQPLYAGISLFPDRHTSLNVLMNVTGKILEIVAGGAPAARTTGHARRKITQPH